MTPRKASRAKSTSIRAERVGYIDPIADIYADVNKACTKYLRERGLIKQNPFSYGEPKPTLK